MDKVLYVEEVFVVKYRPFRCVCRLNLFIYEVVVFFQGTSLFLFFNRLWTLAKSIIRFCKRKPGISPILNQKGFSKGLLFENARKGNAFHHYSSSTYKKWDGMSFASTRLPQPISFPTSERGIIVLFNNTTKEMSKICERPHEIAIYSTRKIF